ncbi:hypothetical protein GKC30_06940 [Pseudodesulfovibrio sp. F-1]|uniref:DUF1858 domain-containing protein n=1 Tax=Pseudodesulfovibrio alkaliphilus TaxID=2661613 RepID=A0A7K1KMP9_9BACT|nr:hypothetical protein [Pseudodesulfovibrio alkaliphilus]MUM77364.1 hypothetical protein [Pseudodesulfovibrio alkaliphilus]
MTAPRPAITASMTLLDTVHAHPETEAVFRSRDQEAGVCLLCAALFESIGTMAVMYGLNLSALLADLNRAIARTDSQG